MCVAVHCERSIREHRTNISVSICMYEHARAHKPCSSLVHSFTRTQPPTHRFAGQAERARGSKETSINHLDTGFGRGLAGRKV